MRVRGVLLWPAYRLAGWADDNPLSAVGAVVALGALVVLLASVGVGGDGASGWRLAYEGITLSAVSEAAAERPAYVVAAVAGAVVVFLYDG